MLRRPQDVIFVRKAAKEGPGMLRGGALRQSEPEEGAVETNRSGR